MFQRHHLIAIIVAFFVGGITSTLLIGNVPALLIFIITFIEGSILGWNSEKLFGRW